MRFFVNNTNEYFAFEDDAPEEFMLGFTPVPPRPNEFCAWNNGGWVEDTLAKLTADKAATNAPILAKMAELENTRQPRAIRDALLGLAGAMARLTDLNAQIEALRAQLVK